MDLNDTPSTAIYRQNVALDSPSAYTPLILTMWHTCHIDDPAVGHIVHLKVAR